MSQAQRVHFHWQSVRALSRHLDPHLTARTFSGQVAPMVDLLKIPDSWRGPLTRMSHVQARGTSGSLAMPVALSAEGEMEWLSALKDGAWQALDTGWELQEYAARLAEMERRKIALAKFAALLSGSDETQREGILLDIQLMNAGWSSNPRNWRRGWTGWWQSEIGLKPG